MPIEPKRDPYPPSGDLFKDKNLSKEFVQQIIDQEILNDIKKFFQPKPEPESVVLFYPDENNCFNFNLDRWVQTFTEMLQHPQLDKLEWEWPTNDNRDLKLKDMTTEHMFNTIRMLVNKAIPRNLRVDGNNKMPSGAIPLHNREREFLCAFFEIISDREDVTQEHLIKLSQLASLAKKYI